MSLSDVFKAGAAALVLFAACTTSPVADQKAEAEKIRQLDKAWVEAIRANDMDKIMAYYVPDAVNIDQDQQATKGVEAIRKGFEAWLSDPLISANYNAPIDDIQVSVAGDMAWDRGTYTTKQSTVAGPVDVAYNWTNIWKKVDGEWKVTLTMSNTSRPVLPPRNSPELVAFFTGIEEEWNRAFSAKDIDALDKLLAEEYSSLDALMNTTDKQKALEYVKSGFYQNLSPSVFRDIQVNLYGTTAVVTGIAKVNQKVDGKPVKGDLPFVDVFVWRDGRWQVVLTK